MENEVRIGSGDQVGDIEPRVSRDSQTNGPALVSLAAVGVALSLAEYPGHWLPRVVGYASSSALTYLELEGNY